MVTFSAGSAFTARTRATHRLTSYGPLVWQSVSDRRRPHGRRIQRFGGPIGAKRRQKRLSSVIFHGFWPFSQRDAGQVLPRFPLRVVRLLLPFFLTGIAARGCVGGEIRAFRLNSPNFTQTRAVDIEPPPGRPRAAKTRLLQLVARCLPPGPRPLLLAP